MSVISKTNNRRKSFSGATLEEIHSRIERSRQFASRCDTARELDSVDAMMQARDELIEARKNTADYQKVIAYEYSEYRAYSALGKD